MSDKYVTIMHQSTETKRYKRLWPSMSVAKYVELCISHTWSHMNSSSSPEYSTLKVEGFEDVEMSELNATQQL